MWVLTVSDVLCSLGVRDGGREGEMVCYRDDVIKISLWHLEAAEHLSQPRPIPLADESPARPTNTLRNPNFLLPQTFLYKSLHAESEIIERQT